MSKADKLLKKIRANPKAVVFEDLDTILRRAGFTCRQPGGGSSHYYYTRGLHTISVPYKRPHIGAIYVKQVLAILDDLADSDAKSEA